MAKKYDFKKEWPRIKKELVRVSKEAMVLAKKGEEQLVKVTKRGKLHVDDAALGLKMEHIYLQVGKEYVKSKCAETKTPKLKKLLNDLAKIEKEKQALGKKIKAGSKARTAARPKAAAKKAKKKT